VRRTSGVGNGEWDQWRGEWDQWRGARDQWHGASPCVISFVCRDAVFGCCFVIHLIYTFSFPWVLGGALWWASSHVACSVVTMTFILLSSCVSSQLYRVYLINASLYT
jgi:hypothetical protein